MLCSRCKKNVAIIFMSRMENGQQINEGLCMSCAKELGIPQVKSMMDSMGLNDEAIEEINNQLSALGDDPEGFEFGGADTMPPFIQSLFDGSGAPEVSQPQNEPKGKKDKKDKKKKRKYLDSYCDNLTEKASLGKLDRVIGRDREIYRVEQILSRRTKNNPCLIGEPGVGKTAIAEGIAQRIAEGKVPFRLTDKQVYLLDLTALVAGTQFRGQFESRVKGLIDEIKEEGNIILVIDEVHNLVGTGDSEGTMNAANILKPALSRGEIQVIGATTFNEYRKYIEKDSALERRFQPVNVEESTVEDAVKILQGIKPYYEKHHRVKVPDDIIRRAVSLSEKYISDRFLPDKAIDLMDEACSCASIASDELARYQSLNRRLKELLDEEEKLENETENRDYEAMAKVKSEIISVKEELRALETKIAGLEVTQEDLARVIELWTGIPAAKINQNEMKRLGSLSDRIKQRIIGQDEAVDLVAAAIKRSRVQLSDRRRPASFIFVGPTGVGKTELVKVLASELFDTVDPLIRLDMSEYMEKYAVSRLIGAPPGYVGYDEAGQLTEKVRRKPYSVILFDEIEKAHPDVMNILLQILDEGRVTDAHGRTVNFENTVIAMTSNAGSSDKNGIVGFDKNENFIAKEKALKSLSEFLRPEFLGRVDEIVVFNQLTNENLVRITGIMLDELKPPLEEKGIKFGYDEAVLSLIVKKASGGKFSARDLRKVIRKEIEDKIAGILVDRYDDNVSLLNISVKNDDGAEKFDISAV